MSGSVEFVFSFRSPYAWIAARRVLPMVHPDTEVRWTPFFPLPSFANFGNLIPVRARYNIEDLLRLSRAYDLEFGRPPLAEPDWSIPHAAFVHAEREGCGPEFGLALADSRWHAGEDVASAEVIGKVAESVGLDGDAAVSASSNAGLRARLTEEIEVNYRERGIFGVPMFVLPDGQRFWGHDRMEWALHYGYVPSAS